MSSQHDPSSHPAVGKLHHQMNLLRLSGFEDGSIVLINDQRTAFRVHLRVLSLNAEYFRDMSGLAQAVPPDAKGDTMIDLGGFNDPLSPRFVHPLVLSAQGSQLLTIPSKPYYAYRPNNQVRSDVIRHLSMVYPSEELADLEKHTDLILPRSDLHSLRAGREYDVPIIILPAAYYYASTTELITNAKPDILAIILAGREKRRRSCVQRCVVLALPGVPGINHVSAARQAVL
ncbi:hypothetical protein IW261DRAFT_1610716 [Armillaria novae-zelandiae]|uniref:BTB domain-containing protein n=1 Tax=Armillaria novae-zelandiae TaxID=153914 RepID=A0AA39U9E1_9AGAR|nr:hypothetical protein IW261DRAFT_1610716 [Armillaria novae-zelandiae]